MNIHEKYINRCIELAKNGLGKTYPNPLVGSVIVYNNKIIGEGWHQKAGRPHAEVNAINSVTDKTLLKQSILYVNLEPCSHYGKTPPCSDLIIANKIPKVVIGSIDPNSKVSGKGIEKLKKSGCDVVTGVLEEECMDLNKRFFTFHNKKRPFIILKWAQTKDGFIDKLRDEDSEQSPNWISNQYSLQLVHKFRSVAQAILVGTNTVLNDNHSLTTRFWKGNNPIRLIIDKELKITSNYKVLNDAAKTIVFTSKKHLASKNISYETINFNKSVIEQIVNILYKNKIQSVIIEGGKQTLQSFIDNNLWDEAYLFVGDKLFYKGLNAPKLSAKSITKKKIKNDVLYIYKNN